MSMNTVDRCNELLADNEALKRELAQWKNNHATVVAQARVLKERIDMPIERVKAYEGWQKATEDRDELAAQVEVMRAALRAIAMDNRAYTMAQNAVAALALPNTSVDILKKRDARVLIAAAEQFELGDFEIQPGYEGSFSGFFLRAMAKNPENLFAPRPLNTTEASHG